MAGHYLHVTKEGERWDLIAFRYYRTVTRMSGLIAANRALFLSDEMPGATAVPAILPSGLKLIVPIVDEETLAEDVNLPPWKRNAPNLPTGSL